MYGLRPFSNADPPALSRIWGAQPPQRGIVPSIPHGVFDELIVSKQYFDREGLIVATHDATPVGFVHAGFGQADDGSQLDPQLGVTAMLMVEPRHQSPQLVADLIATGEQYLKNKGSQVLYAGEIRGLDPFYRGLYGGSEQPGILCSDTERWEWFHEHGYRLIDTVLVWHLDLAQFRPQVSRQTVQHRRQTQLTMTADPAPNNWWEAHSWAGQSWVEYALRSKDDEQLLASARVWQVEPLGASWGLRVAGLVDLVVPAEHRRQHYATFFMGLLFRQLQVEGFTTVEVQTMQHNTPATSFYEKLGFVEIDRGGVLRKQS